MSMATVGRTKALLCAALITGLVGARESASAQTSDTSLEGLSRELGRLQQDVQKKNREIGQLIEAYERQGGKLPEGFGPNLSEEQRKLLAERFQQERLGLGSTLQDILDRDREIAGLRRRIAEIEGLAPYSVVARAGDTHMGLVRTFLQGKGMSPPETARLLSQVSLHPSLNAGNRVFILYRAGQLGTWVTAGTSKLNSRPAAASTAAATSATSTTKLTGSRDAVKRVRVLELAMEATERENVALRKESAQLRADIGGWSQEVDRMKDVARAAVEGARYVAGSRMQLQQYGILSGHWLKGTRVNRLERMDVLDLTQTAQIVLNAAQHGLMRIEKVELLPQGFVPEQDYVVDYFEGGQYARVALLDVDKFKGAAFVIAME